MKISSHDRNWRKKDILYWIWLWWLEITWELPPSNLFKEYLFSHLKKLKMRRFIFGSNCISISFIILNLTKLVPGAILFRMALRFIPPSMLRIISLHRSHAANLEVNKSIISVCWGLIAWFTIFTNNN